MKKKSKKKFIFIETKNCTRGVAFFKAWWRELWVIETEQAESCSRRIHRPNRFCQPLSNIDGKKPSCRTNSRISDRTCPLVWRRLDKMASLAWDNRVRSWARSRYNTVRWGRTRRRKLMPGLTIQERDTRSYWPN
jgi:hypothetical protein